MPAFVLLVGLAAEIYFLLSDISPGRLPASSSTPTTPPIGELVSIQNSVKVQNEGELVWEDTHGKQTLLRRQSLLTLENSRAEVAFLDGTGLMIDEKSLILLEKTPSDDSTGYQRIVVRLLHGTLHKSSPRKSSDLLRRLGAKTPEIEVDTGDSRIELSPSSELTIVSRPDDPEGARITVQSGEVKVDSPHGGIIVKTGEEASLPKAGADALPVAHKLPFSLLSPKPGQSIEALQGAQPVRFRWNAVREAVAGRPQEIEVSRDPAFKSGNFKTRIPAAEPPLEYVEINLSLPAQEGASQWYWRVHAITQNAAPAASSGTENFWIRPQTVPQLSYPVEHAKAPAQSSLDFSWQPFDAATGYELEISGRASIQTSDCYARVEQMAPGTSRWRVRAKLSDGTLSEWSAQRAVEIHEAREAASAAATPNLAEPPPPPEELDEPEIRRANPTPLHTRLWDLLVDSAFADESPDAWVVHLKWHSVSGVQKYKVQVSRDQTFAHVIAESETPSAEWDWNFKLGMQNSKGRAFFRVASISGSGVTGAFSKPKPIQIPKSILKPEVYAAKDIAPGAQPFQGADGIQGADAADRSDLDTLAAKKSALSKDLSGPRVGPPSLAALREGEKGVATNPRPLAAPVSVAQAEAPLPTQSSWIWQVALQTGYGSMSQSSAATDISSVSLQGPYLQQKLSISGELTRAQSNAETAWIGEFELRLAGFHGPDSPPNPLQNAIKGVGFRLDGLYSWAKNAGAWTFYLGGGLDRSFRWFAAGNNQSVDTLGALSFGPSARAVRNYQHNGPLFSARAAGIALELPMTGLLYSAQAGAESRIWGEWNLASFKENALCLSLRTEGEAFYLHWGSPNGTTTLAWAFWLAPALSF